MDDQVYERARELMEGELGDEIVALDPVGGHCFGLNRVAAFIWRELAQPRSFAELKGALLKEFDVEEARCEADLIDLLRQLQEDGLVQLRERYLPVRV